MIGIDAFRILEAPKPNKSANKVAARRDRGGGGGGAATLYNREVKANFVGEPWHAKDWVAIGDALSLQMLVYECCDKGPIWVRSLPLTFILVLKTETPNRVILDLEALNDKIRLTLFVVCSLESLPQFGQLPHGKLWEDVRHVQSARNAECFVAWWERAHSFKDSKRGLWVCGRCLLPPRCRGTCLQRLHASGLLSGLCQERWWDPHVDTLAWEPATGSASGDKRFLLVTNFVLGDYQALRDALLLKCDAATRARCLMSWSRS